MWLAAFLLDKSLRFWNGFFSCAAARITCVATMDLNSLLMPFKNGCVTATVIPSISNPAAHGRIHLLKALMALFVRIAWTAGCFLMAKKRKTSLNNGNLSTIIVARIAAWAI